MDPGYDVMRMALYLCGLPLKNPQSHSNHLKISDKFQERDILQNTWPVLLKTIKVIKNKENLRNCYNQEDLKET